MAHQHLSEFSESLDSSFLENHIELLNTYKKLCPHLANSQQFHEKFKIVTDSYASLKRNYYLELEGWNIFRQKFQERVLSYHDSIVEILNRLLLKMKEHIILKAKEKKEKQQLEKINITQILNENKALKNQVNTLITTEKALQFQKTKFSQTLKEITTEKDYLNNEIKSLINENDDLKDRLSSKDATIKNLLGSTNTSLAEELQALKNRVAELEEEVDNLTDENYRLAGKVIGYEEDIKASMQTQNILKNLKS